MNLRHRAESSLSYTGEHNLPVLKYRQEELHKNLATESLTKGNNWQNKVTRDVKRMQYALANRFFEDTV